MVHQCIGCDAYMLPAILCIYLPPLFFAAIRLRFLKGTASDKKNEASRSQITFKIIDAGIMNGFETLLKLCGYIVIFSILCKPLSLLKNSIPFVSLLFGSILEVTNGISCIAGHGFSKKAMFLLCTTCTSFGGICGIAQTSSMISDTTLSMSAYIRDKLFFSVMTFGLSLIHISEPTRH